MLWMWLRSVATEGVAVGVCNAFASTRFNNADAQRALVARGVTLLQSSVKLW